MHGNVYCACDDSDFLIHVPHAQVIFLTMLCVLIQQTNQYSKDTKQT